MYDHQEGAFPGTRAPPPAENHSACRGESLRNILKAAPLFMPRCPHLPRSGGHQEPGGGLLET